jgi:thymidylate kinase
MLRVNVTGIDGCGKSSAIKAANDYLKNQQIAVKVRYIPVDYFDSYFFSFPEQKLERIWLWGDRHKIKFISAIAFSLSTLLCNFSFWLHKFSWRKKFEVLITERDSVVDALVYFDFYFGWIKKILPLSYQTQIRLKKLLEGLPDILIYLEVDPQTALSRIEKRLEEGEKKKTRHLHEDQPTLLKLLDFYDQILPLAKKEKKEMEIVKLNTQTTPAKEVGKKISEIIIELKRKTGQ